MTSPAASLSGPAVAYFCMEYGLDQRLPIYSGGLGVLAGDTMKSVGDLRRPVTGIGLFWNQGYTHQRVEGGQVHDAYVPAPRDALAPVEARIEVTVRGKTVPCIAWKVDRYVGADLFLIEPANEDDRWITQRLYGGGAEDRLAQEILLGVGGVRLLEALGREPDVYHFNEGHAVFAGLELLRSNRFGGTSLAERIANLRPHVVFTTHTPVAAGNEVHALSTMRTMDADVGFTDAELIEIGGGDPFSMTVAGLRLARTANAVAELHGETARTMWRDVAGAAPIISITNGVHVPTWQDPRVRAALAPGKDPGRQDDELWMAHGRMKAELLGEIAARSGVAMRPDRLLIGFARRAAAYKRADLILGDDARLERLFTDSRVQLVYAGKTHPRDEAGKAMLARLTAAAERWGGSVVFLQDYDLRLGAMLTRGCDVWLNNPRRPLEASGTSGMKAAMNGVLNLSILDGWWPEGCRHGETGWRIGDPSADGDSHVEDLGAEALAAIDDRDRRRLYEVLEGEVMPRYYGDRRAWIAMMRASIEMSSWQFSSDRMVEDYFAKLYTAT
ncbi:MAG: alpha-glucan family phosphorylase [Kofleriaceae bacterium]